MASPIRVVLKEDVENLGSGGEVVRVRPGYARNYLIPRGLALPATKGNLARVDDLKKQVAQRAQKALDDAKELGAKLESTSIKLARAVGAENKMYGSVTSRDIEEALAEQGIEIDRKRISLDEPIRELGLAEVPIKLHAEVSVALRVEVIKKA